MEAIRRSDYLSFTYEQFARHKGPLVVFGHSLGGSDQHIVDVMNRWSSPLIAISILRDDPRILVERKKALTARLPHARILFFDAQTHPLGSPNLKIVEEGAGSI